jgi:transketolase
LVRARTPVLHDDDHDPEIGSGEIMRDGDDVAVIAHGAMVQQALSAADLLEERGIDARVINMATIKPLDRELVVDTAERTGAIVTAEDHNVIGGLGSAVAEVVAEEHPTAMARVGLDDQFGTSGDGPELYEHFGLTGSAIAAEATDLIDQ